MARTVVTPTQLSPNGFVALTFTAADTTNKNRADMTGLEVLLVHNTGAGSGTYTVESAADPSGRTDDITTEAVAADGMAALGPFKSLKGWTYGTSLNLEGSATTMKFAWIRLPQGG